MAGSMGIGVLISHFDSHSDSGTCLRTWEIYFFKRQRFSGVQEQESPDKSFWILGSTVHAGNTNETWRSLCSQSTAHDQPTLQNEDISFFLWMCHFLSEDEISYLDFQSVCSLHSSKKVWNGAHPHSVTGLTFRPQGTPLSIGTKSLRQVWQLCRQSSRAKGLLTWYTSQVIKINHKTSQRCQIHIQRHLLIPKITCEGTEWGTQSQAGSASLEVEACFPGGVNGMHRKTCGVAGKVGKCREWDSRSTWKRIFKELTTLGS